MAEQISHKIDRRLVGMGAVNPFGSSNSSSRAYMTISHVGSALTLNKPEIPLVSSGMEGELALTSFGVKAPTDMYVYDVIIIYSNTKNEIPTDDDISRVTIVYMEANTNVIDSITINRYEQHDPVFGFEHTFTPLLSAIIDNEDVGMIPKDTPLTRTNGEVKPGLYGYGIHTTVCTASHPDVAEDAITITESYSDRMSYYTYKEYDISVGVNDIPLNQYGDIDNYRSLPRVGDKVSGYLFATRTLDNTTNDYPSLFNKKSLMEVSPDFDNIYPLSKGECEVVELEVIRSSRRTTMALDEVYQQLNELADEFDQDAAAYVYTANKVEEDVYRKNLKVGGALHTDIVYNKKLLSSDVIRRDGRGVLSPYIIRVKVRYLKQPHIGGKVSNRHGGKGVISNVIPDNEAPYDENGLRADMIISDVSSIHRMNLGGEHEGYVSSIITVLRNKIISEINQMNDKLKVKEFLSNNTKYVNDTFDYILGLVEICSREQYDIYKSFKVKDKINLIVDIYNEGLYLYIPYDSEYSKYDISKKLLTSKYALKDNAIHYFNRESKKYEATHATGHMKVQYTMVLDKTASDWLAVSSANLNTLGMPVPPSKGSKARYAYNHRPVKINSETETRFIAFYCGEEALAELRDRNLSIDTFKHLYSEILLADNIFEKDCIIDRKKIPFGNDVSVQVMDALLASCGEEIKVV